MSKILVSLINHTDCILSNPRQSAGFAWDSGHGSGEFRALGQSKSEAVIFLLFCGSALEKEY